MIENSCFIAIGSTQRNLIAQCLQLRSSKEIKIKPKIDLQSIWDQHSYTIRDIIIGEISMVVLEVISLAGIRYVWSPNFGRSNLELSPGRSLNSAAIWTTLPAGEWAIWANKSRIPEWSKSTPRQWSIRSASTPRSPKRSIE